MKRTLAFSICIISIILLFSACGTKTPDDLSVVAAIGGEPVALGEIKMFLSGTDDTAERALEEMAPYMVCRRELKRLDSETFASYEEFLDGWHAENARRTKAAAQGEVIYGPETLSQRIFFDYSHEDDMQLLESLMPFDPTYEELKSAYGQRTDLFTVMGTVNMRVILLPKGEDTAVLSELRDAVAGGESFDETISRLGLSDVSYPRSFDENSFREPDVTEFDGVADAITSLPAGEFCEPIDNHGEGFIVLYCESRDGAGRRPFEDCREELAIILSEEAFEREFEAMVADAEIVIIEDIENIAASPNP